MSFSSIEEVKNYLDALPAFQSEGASAARFDLSRFRAFCNKIGAPHKVFSSIHVAGTNGKGSTCRILAAVFRKAGYKTALYTSPHILRFNERFSIDGNFISDNELLKFFRENNEYIKEFKLTYFEISTAIAFWWFARNQPDIAIIETGLGGRLDATNILTPLLSIITSISKDHTDLLGDDLKTIAREKGGIIKSNTPVVIGDLPQEARIKIMHIAEQKNCRLSTIESLNPEFIKPGCFKLEIEERNVMYETNLSAPVQAKNIAIASCVVSLLNKQYPGVERKFAEAIQNVDIGYGHFEKLHPDKQWYFDGAHNLEAVKTLKTTIETLGNVKEATLVLSILKDKVTAPVMREFSEFENIYYYGLNLERAATFADIKKWLPHANPLPDDQHHLLSKEFGTELVIFAGSFYFYATVRDWVKALALNN
jgi:dihydrofolate synthase/folylpolyglutamate synthase